MCGIGAIDPDASRLVSQLVQIMQLRSDAEPGRILLVHTDRVDLQDNRHEDLRLRSEPEEPPQIHNRSEDPLVRRAPQFVSEPGSELAFFHANENLDEDKLILNLIRLSHAVLHHAQPTGYLLIHGALIEYERQGFLLAGPGGEGKSTASKRIPPPWQAHSDDVTLLVPDSHGGFWAHPWPTWSDFFFGGKGGCWDVQFAIPLKAIFFIHQADQDQTQVTGEGEAVCLLLEVVEQASRVADRDMNVQERRDTNLMRFEIITQLTKSIPYFKLDITKTGAFWHEIERACDLVNP
jgi:hypothetical protein